VCWLGPPCQTSVSFLTRVQRLSCVGVLGIPSQPVANFSTSSVPHPSRAFCETPFRFALLAVCLPAQADFWFSATRHLTFLLLHASLRTTNFMSSTPAVGTPNLVVSPVSSNAPSLPSVPPSHTPSPSGVNTVSLLTAVTTSPTPTTSALVTTSVFSEQPQQPSSCVHIQLLRLLCMNYSQCFTNHDGSNHCGYYRDTVVGKSIRSPHFCKHFINVLFHAVCDNRHLEQ
jgi:hypothetical protein